jgi:hypothetical protein
LLAGPVKAPSLSRRREEKGYFFFFAGFLAAFLAAVFAFAIRITPFQWK